MEGAGEQKSGRETASAKSGKSRTPCWRSGATGVSRRGAGAWAGSARFVRPDEFIF